MPVSYTHLDVYKRQDLGALSHFDMVWPSDNTDPVDRLEIQQGYSLLYPTKCMRAWVTDTNLSLIHI